MTRSLNSKRLLAKEGVWSLWANGACDADYVATHLRDADLKDIAAASRHPPAIAIARSLAQSDTTIQVLEGERPLAVGGLGFCRRHGQASIWLIGTTQLDAALRSGGARLCRPWFRLVVGDTPAVFNYVAKDNEKSLRWLSWLGFEALHVVENYRGLGEDCRFVQWKRDAAR